MLPSFFVGCDPITRVEDIEEVLLEPPTWIERVEPLRLRSPTVIQNVITDCHSELSNFKIRQRLDRRIVRKTLVCHDYKGGYLDDKYLHNENEDILGDGYTFYNWAQIDYFVYFSHHFITIPPLCWINVGHKNGVKILGTLITEFKPGTEICDQKIFTNLDTMQQFAKNLVKITRVFGFDGWLLNIENSVKNTMVLKEFVTYFTELLHFENREYVVIWYDSVTEKGELKWQDELNDSNRFFFDACDGIFLNYCWDETKLIKTAQTAQHRYLDVFVGIDVFGRNMYGGGQFNTYKAAQLVAKHNLSIALFAPGWTHETLEKDKPDEFFKKFLSRDYALWSSLWPFLYTNPVNDYFNTDFYIGLDKSCYNLLNQKRQLSRFPHPELTHVVPNFKEIPTLNEKCSCIQGVTLTSRNALLLTNKVLPPALDYVHYLFACDLEIQRNTIVYFLTKNDKSDPNCKLGLTLLTSHPNDSVKKIKLLSEYKMTPVNNVGLLEVNPSTSEDLIEHVKSKHAKLIEEESLQVSAYLFHTNRVQLMEVGATLEKGHSIFLCGFGLEDADTTFLRSMFIQNALDLIRS